MEIKEIIEKYLKKESKDEDEINEQYSDRANSAPCELCGCKHFIKLYRNVVGEVEGSMRGNFSLFGGSVSGSISGDTKILPVLSCKECHNEKIITTWKYTYATDVFWSDMHNFYFGLRENDDEKFKEIKSIYLENPLETREYMLENKNYEYDFFDSLAYYSIGSWAKAGFKINKITIKKKFLFFKWEEIRYPTWNEFKNLNK